MVPDSIGFVCLNCQTTETFRARQFENVPDCKKCGQQLLANSVNQKKGKIMADLLKKISAKQVVGNVKKVVADSLKNDGDKMDLYNVIGIATGVKTGETDYGPWIAFTGQFEATNIETGEVFQSGKCHMPEPLDQMIHDVIVQKDTDGNPAVESVQFAYTVGVKRRDDLQVGYEYTLREIVSADAADPLAALRDQSAKQLSAPAKKAAKK